MFHFTYFDAYVGAACITAAGAIHVGRRQNKTRDEIISSRDILLAMRQDMVDLRSALTAHTTDDAANFRELRDAVGPRRRRGWFMPALGLLIHLFLK